MLRPIPLLIALLSTLLPLRGWAQGGVVKVMQWNVENLFDCHHDTLKDDHEFLPEGSRHWTPWRYWRKVNDIGRVILGTSEGDAHLPDLVGLAEVENDTCMIALTRRGLLRGMGYEYVMTDSPDLRGIDVALLYRPTSFALVGWETRRIPTQAAGLSPTRDLLLATGTLPNGDTLHVIVCHFPSRLNGRRGNKGRQLASLTLRSVVDSLGAGANVLVLGDFNAPAHDPVFSRLRPVLIDLVPQSRRPSEGSYRYKGRWSWIDHILVTPPLAGRVSEPALYTAPWLQDPDSHGGWRPRRTYTGPAYHGGVSDHVPLVSILTWGE